MIQRADLEDRILKYVGGSLSLDDLDHWFTGASWNMHQDADDATQALAAAVELTLAEHSSGRLTDRQLMSRLWSLVGVDRWFIAGAREGVSMTTRVPAEGSRFELPGQRIERYSSPAGSSARWFRLLRTQERTAQTGIGGKLPRPA